MAVITALALTLGAGLVVGAPVTASAAIAPAAVTTVPIVTISGTTTVGQTLTASAGTWDPGHPPLRYSWLRNDELVADTTAETYALTAADLDATMIVVITGVIGGAFTQVRSVPTATIAAAPFTTAPVPTISGTAHLYQTLTAASAAWVPSGATLTYQWLRNGAAITGATGASYVLTPADLRATVALSVTAVKAGYTTTMRTSASTTAIRPAQFTSAPSPTITGTTTVGQTLTATTGVWAPTPEKVYTMWMRNDSVIADATATTYVLTPDDLGAVLTFSFVAAKTNYSSTAVRSAGTAEIAAAPFTTTPVPTISGTTTVGQLLTASAGTWAPSVATLSFQWLNDGEAIADATASTYVLSPTDLGATLTVSVTALKHGYLTATTTSITTAIIAAGAFTPVPPTISGTTTVDQTLTASAGTGAPSGATLTYQWLRNGTPVADATGSTYALTAADLDAVVTVTVTAVKAGYVTASTTSVATAAVAATPFTGAPVPVVTGNPTVDQTLTAAAGDWAPTGATLTYQWVRDGSAVADATGSTYALTPDDLGAVMTVEVTAVKTGYVTETIVSVPTAIIVAAPFTLAPIPTISGTATVEQTLTATPGDWEPTGATLTYQWLRNGTPVGGATASTYVLGVDDFDSVLTVQVTGVKTGYVTQTTESLPTEAIAAAAFTTTEAPNVTGYAMVNQTLSATVADWTPVATISWQWLRNGVAIGDATDATYLLTADDEGAVITVTATGSAAGYITASTVGADSAAVAPIPVNSTPAQNLTADTGGMITVSGYGFIPGEDVEVWLHSTPVLLGTLIAAADGTVSGAFALPAGTVTGIHHIVLTGLQSGSVTSLDITVEKPAALTSSLAKTGTNLTLTGWLALLLAVSGLGLVLVRRRHTRDLNLARN